MEFLQFLYAVLWDWNLDILSPNLVLASLVGAAFIFF